MTPYKAPTLHGQAFNCPHCNAFSKQDWHQFINARAGMGAGLISICEHCKRAAVWIGLTMVYPDNCPYPVPNPDLPEDITADFNEARAVIQSSPRGAAALFRLCIQKLCVHLGEPGKNLNTDIGSLVKKGLSPKVQKSLDIVRVVGNEAVHPGTIDLQDKPETAVQLAALINIIAEVMISQPKMVDQLYNSLPDNKLKEIQRRDEKTGG